MQPPVEFAPDVWHGASQFISDLRGLRAKAPDGLGSVERSMGVVRPPGPADEPRWSAVLDRRDEIVGTSRAPPVVLRALVNAIDPV